MSDVSHPEKISLWRLGMRSFAQHWREWLPLAAIFFVVLIICNAELLQILAPFKAKAQELKRQEDPHVMMALFKNQLPAIIGFIISATLVIYIEHYVFYAFFMKKEFPVETPPATVREFFCFVSKNIQFIFIIAVPTVAGVIVSAGLQKLSPLLFVLGILAAFALMIFLTIRFFFAIPLAAAKKTAPLKNSWEITRSNFWRLFGNILMLTLIFLGIYLLVVFASAVVGFIFGFIVGFAKLQLGDAKTLISGGIGAVIGSVFPVLVAGISASYASAAIRVLYEEKRQIDPNFILTTRS